MFVVHASAWGIWYLRLAMWHALHSLKAGLQTSRRLAKRLGRGVRRGTRRTATGTVARLNHFRAMTQMGTVMVPRNHARSAFTRVSDGAIAFCFTRFKPDSACVINTPTSILSAL